MESIVEMKMAGKAVSFQDVREGQGVISNDIKDAKLFLFLRTEVY
jgi:hypothetical protein